MQNESDIAQLEKDLGGFSLGDYSDKEIVDYLQQWENVPLSQHDSDMVDEEEFNTAFRGKLFEEIVEGKQYLLSRNNRMAYVGLSVIDYNDKEG
jgi:hypothetical protein